GPTGSGKSSFISKVRGIDEGVGHSLSPCTKEVKVLKCTTGEFAGVVLVDTPSFDDTRKSGLRSLNQILNKIAQREIFPACATYFHRITDNRISRATLSGLQAIKKLCGYHNSQIILVTSMWDEAEEDVGRKRLEELREQHWGEMVAGGSTTFCHLNTTASAKQLLREVVSKAIQQRHIQLQQAIEGLRTELGKGEAAGQELGLQLDELAERWQEVFRSPWVPSHDATSSVKDCLTEYAELKAKVSHPRRVARTSGQPLVTRTMTRLMQRVQSKLSVFQPLPVSLLRRVLQALAHLSAVPLSCLSVLEAATDKS
ncbi:hypothetical protein ID866_9826, partial [Astraeus odoratus]